MTRAKEDPHEASSTESSAIDLDAFRRGDDECFRIVLERFGPTIEKVVWSFADTDDDRDELYQEVCIRILEQRARYSEQGAMAQWIATVARRTALNWRKSMSAREAAKERYAALVVPIEAAGHITADPSRLLNYRNFLARVTRILDALPKSQATAFKLVQVQGYSPREAAEILTVSTATVRSNLRHARKRLREELAEVKDEMS